MIWFKEVTWEQLTQFPPNIGTVLGIEFTEWDDNSIQARMPVDARTHQPFGILHGGASVVLAETLGSVASLLVVDPAKYRPVGLEVNANHLRPVKNGYVTGVCTPLHIGGKTHVWDIKIYTENQKLVCISRLTVAIIPA
ncbi:1,4-dihydroxy-2-naphthoyl-CoA hydrolase [Filimonas lacunae]|uniref:1,4-dihydroxy-2-naphthoyl-CoA hydrolase n=1 Tax=Filimonas lacunae TaxID=477680 RepID=A0A173MQZ8_9BACT|nr:hotdog fold thioesterase [Filimonas lacunae]BAV09870.1 ComA operon protein 2 [Filimonas lacunae]SIS80252.1 1,4-dihydroxy-2-naphthoyl-CoA hydrolase [Filimonas lacunae]